MSRICTGSNNIARRVGVALAAALALGLAGGEAAAQATDGPCARADFRIAIDVGHYDAAPGATSARGVPERAFNLRLARILKDRLAAGGFTGGFLIAESGAKISLKARVRLANATAAHVFVSIHHDSAQEHLLTPWTYRGRDLLYTDDISGFSLFVSRENAAFERGLRLAKMIGAEMLAAGFAPTLHHADPIPGENRDLLDPRLGVYRWDRLGVVRTTTMPAVLFEAGVILNRADEEELAKPETRLRIADAVVSAADQFLCGGGGAQ